jgi:hypothetical protein
MKSSEVAFTKSSSAPSRAGFSMTSALEKKRRPSRTRHTAGFSEQSVPIILVTDNGKAEFKDATQRQPSRRTEVRGVPRAIASDAQTS